MHIDSVANNQKPLISWCGPGGATLKGASGEFIYDLRVLEILKGEFEINEWAPPAQPRLRQVANLMFGMPWHRHRYKSKAVERHAIEHESWATANVVSWEPFDFLLHAYKKNTVYITHNLTSDALLQTHPGNIIAKVFAWIAQLYEKKIFRSGHLSALIVLSDRDKTLVQKIAPELAIIVAPPGMPRRQLLKSTAVVDDSELVLSGSYGWRAKRRDCVKFLNEVAETNYRVASDDPLPRTDNRVEIVPANLNFDGGASDKIRLGLIPDQFLAGHKLKSTFLISRCCIVLSFCDLSSEFNGIAHANLFVHHIKTVHDIKPITDTLNNISDAALRSMFDEFQSECSQKFCWHRTGRLIAQQIKVAQAA